MSQTGRRNIRKALKNDELTFADETGIGEADFRDTMYPVFEETGRRGGFVLRPPSFYYEMLRELGPQVCRLFVVRHRGEVVAWTLVTVYDGAASYYFAASKDAARDLYAVYRLVWGVLQTLHTEQLRTFDFCGAGSARAPELETLNRFKLNFGKKALVDIPGPWDVILRPGVMRAYNTQRSALSAAARAKTAARELPHRVPRSKADVVGMVDAATSAAASAVTRVTPPSTAAPAVLPVVLDFTLSGYALARAFHERYGLTSVALVPFATGAIADSSVISQVRELGRGAVTDPKPVLQAIREVAKANPALTVIPLTNNDALVQSLAAERNSLGKNVVVPHETPEMLHRVSDKVSFNELCAAAGVATPRTEVLDFAGGRPDADAVDLPWPIIVKPADSGRFAGLRLAGKKKLYRIDDRPALEELIGQLHQAGFDGQMLAQEFIPGEDLLSITLYRARDGRITLARASQVLMQDPRAAYLGIPDVQVVTELDDAVEQGARILAEADYHGFANLDAIRDPRDGRVVFFEINPRYGRNCHYATATGANIAEQLVGDLIEDSPVEAPALSGELVYTTVPPRFVERYVGGAAGARVAALAGAGRLADPLKYDGERNPKHRAYAAITARNHARAYRGQPPTLRV
nr:GNAT family N-acetyltransferase [Flexivirga meconopsidis]